MDGSQAARDELMIAGARAFLQGLHRRGVTLYLASGTDHVYVLEEAAVLGVAEFFGEHIYGARDDAEAYTKARIIQRILDEHGLHGEELLVVGDGPVEIRHANGYRTRYAHLSTIADEVKVSKEVTQGQVIGTVGNSGTPGSLYDPKSEVHLHFEVWLDDRYVGQYLSTVEIRRLLSRVLR